MSNPFNNSSLSENSSGKEEGNVVHEKEQPDTPAVASSTQFDPLKRPNLNASSLEEEKQQQIGVEKLSQPNTNPKPRYTVKDLINTPPPNIKERFHLYFYNKGLSSRPKYLNEIYNNTPRYIYFNQDLPEDMVHHDSKTPILSYPRNKIRTTKYTPLTFLPKNILFQFTNVANTYFLVVVILGAFQIFGVASPGLAAVPLIVIVCITAARDAFEDYRRGSSDNELNNSPIHLLQGLDNPNVLSNYVGPWRRFKKASTRATRKVIKGIYKGCIMVFAKREKKKEFIRQEVAEQDDMLHRVSTVQSDYTFDSQLEQGRLSTSSRPRRSMFSHRKSSQHHVKREPSKPEPNSLLNPETQKLAIEHNTVADTTFKNRCWKDINVGEIIRVRANEEIPADIIAISCSDLEGNCYIETKNLDGETNLKNKTSLSCGGSSNLKHSYDLGSMKFWVECDAPNSQLYSFKGTIHYENFNEKGELVNPDEKEPITNDNVLLRGSTLRNTKWVIGLVVYTGSETKIMLNSGITPTKTSRISRELNLSVILNFVLVFILCFVSGLINGLFYNKHGVSRRYFDFKPYASTPAANGIVAFFVTLIIYQSLIPISLYISVEIIKTLQAFFIFSDLKMYYPKLDFPCIPKSWNISDDLGQIEYVFSDKTGTLTQNVMEFKKCTIAGKSYGLAYTEAKQGLDKRSGLDIVKENEKWSMKIQDDRLRMLESLRAQFNNDQLRDENLTFVSSEYVEDTLVNKESKHQKSANERFMLALALCHTVVTEENEEDEELRDFKAESPDEAALVSVARDLGITFKERLRKTVILEVYGKSVEYEVLEMIPFTSTRKRMSCIFRTPEGKVLLICKGADNVIFQRLLSNSDEEVIQKTALHLEDYAKEGLRTLCIAQKEVDPGYFDNWSVRYRDAHASIDDSREEIIEGLSEEIEQELTLLGGTAIEDRLQQGVPDAISLLADGGIKLWVLTGDRIETAINIGFSCNLLGNDMQLLVVRPDENDPDNIQYVDDLLTKYLSENFNINTSSTDEINSHINDAMKDHSISGSNNALIIDGAALTLVFDNSDYEAVKNVRRKFLLLGKNCKSVICCRVSPSQKALVVSTVKSTLKVMTLAIGDGANDVAMIQAANIGVGIAGEEGRQAVMSSDYAIGQFRFLARLLLVHGRWSYKRLAEMVPCFFYKNVVFTLTCFWYGIYNDFDGSYLYEYTFLMFYNLAFTSLPVIVLAVLDQDVSDSVSLVVPQLYRAGILGLEWSQYKFLWYMLDGLYQSVISFYFPYLLFYVGFQNPQGLSVDHRFWMGVVAACISVTACNIYVVLQQYRWDWLSILIDVISILLVFFWTGVWSARIYAAEFYKAGAQVLGTLACWCCIFIAVIVCVLPRFTYDFLKRNFHPRDIDIIREKARQGEYMDYPEGYDPTNLEDIERHRILTRINNGDTELLARVESAIENTNGSEPIDHPENDKPIIKTFKTIKRRATIRQSRRSTVNEQNKHHQQLLSKPIDLQQLRLQMIKAGEYNTARNSLDRISTTHELPGLTQAETLLSYHQRSSINFDRN